MVNLQNQLSFQTEGHGPNPKTGAIDVCQCGVVGCLVLRCRELASQGYSRTHVADVLEIEHRKFFNLVRHLPVIWPAPNQSIRDREGQKRRAEKMRKGLKNVGT